MAIIYKLGSRGETVKQIQRALAGAGYGVMVEAGRINEKKAVEFGQRLRQLVIDMTGYDPHEFWNDPKNFEPHE